MIQINLLPWREIQRENAKRRILLMIGLTTVLCLLLLSGMHGWIVVQIHGQEKRNESLKKQSIAIETTQLQIETIQKQKQILLDKVAHFNHLHAQQTAFVLLFQEIEKVVPLDLRLTSIAKIGPRILIEGRTKITKNLTLLVAQIHLSQSLADPVLSLMEMKEEPDNHKEMGFQLTCSFR